MAKRTYKTMRGRPIDMGALIAANAEKIAVGNSKMNARGDILGANGVVLRTQEQVEAEWLRNQQRQQEVADMISNNIKAALPADRIPNKVLAADQNFEPDVVPDGVSVTDNGDQSKKVSPPRRKIIETD